MGKVKGMKKTVADETLHRTIEKQEIIDTNMRGRMLYTYWTITTLEPKRHVCVCKHCNHNPLASTPAEIGYCLCGHSCTHDGCKICGSYDITPKVKDKRTPEQIVNDNLRKDGIDPNARHKEESN